MRSKVIYDLVEGNLQVIKHWLSLRLVIIIRNHLIEDTPVACLLDVSGNRKDHPQWIIGEVTTDIGVTLLGQWLILMVAAAILKLS